LIYTSRGDNPFIFHQNKISKIITTFINSISPNLLETNPIVSGSYMIKLIVQPEAEFHDYDLYFSNQKDYDQATKILTNVSLDKKESKNCVSFSIPGFDKQIQLINSFSLPADIIGKHDFANSMVCWQNGNIFFHKDFFSSWKYLSLLIKNKQFKFENDSYVINNSWLAKYCILVARVDKYVKRYKLSLAPQTRATLIELKTLLEENQDTFSTFDFSLIKSNNFSKFIYSVDSDRFSISSTQDLIQKTLGLIGDTNETSVSEF